MVQGSGDCWSHRDAWHPVEDGVIPAKGESQDGFAHKSDEGLGEWRGSEIVGRGVGPTFKMRLKIIRAPRSLTVLLSLS